MQLVFLWAFFFCAVHDPAGTQNAYAEATDRRVRDTEDVPILRADHVSIEAILHGVRKVSYRCGVFNCREMTSRFGCE